MKVLITGASGQLGRALQVLSSKHELTSLAHKDLDITSLNDVRKVVSSLNIDIVINAAAYTDVDGAGSNWDIAFKVNALGPRNLALVTAEKEIPLLHVSTDYVFDGRHTRPYHEFDRPNPQSTYGRSKMAGEQAVTSLNRRHYIVRTAWLYSATGKNFPLTMLSKRENPEVRVVSDQYGSPTYAPHLAAGIGQLLDTRAYGVYHLAGHGSASWFELTVKLYLLMGIQTPVRPVSTAEFPRPAVRPAYSVLTTIHEPKISLPQWEEGLAELATTKRT